MHKDFEMWEAERLYFDIVAYEICLTFVYIYIYIYIERERERERERESLSAKFYSSFFNATSFVLLRSFFNACLFSSYFHTGFWGQWAPQFWDKVAFLSKNLVPICLSFLFKFLGVEMRVCLKVGRKYAFGEAET